MAVTIACSTTQSMAPVDSLRPVLDEQVQLALKCAERAGPLMEVSVGDDGRFAVRHAPDRPLYERGTLGPGLPIDLGPAFNRLGRWIHVQRPDGWLLGLDAGEFGGGLWWISKTGDRQQILDAQTPVVSLGDGAHGTYVVTHEGLDLNSGAELIIGFRTLTRVGTGPWRVGTTQQFRGDFLVALDAAEDGIYILGSRTLSLWTGREWVTVSADFQPLDPKLGPFSMAADRDAAYVGMRLLVLRIPKSGRMVSWFVDSKCQQFDYREVTCQCMAN
jgi:hypothetical protein